MHFRRLKSKWLISDRRTNGVNMKKTVALILLISVFCLGATEASSQSSNTPRLQSFITGLTRPILLRSAKDGTNRIFVVQQTGIIKVFQPGSNTPTDFINLSSKIIVPTTVGDEQGLLGLTFHPQFATNGKFYVNYVRAGPRTTVVAEYTTVPGNPEIGNFSSERILFTVPQPFSNHNGGMIEFGPDGYLYIGMGDGGSADDPGNRAQNPAQLLGKMLRIDVNIPNGSPVPYLIPPTNPFVGVNTTRCETGSTTVGNTCQELWTIGMRNPWRWSFDRGGTNQLYVADVGQNVVEELDIIDGGNNYGWRVWEGNSCNTNITGNCPSTMPYSPPYFTYNHVSGRCSVTGGYVYRGTQSALPLGAYTFADYCTGEVWLWNNNAQELIIPAVSPTPKNVVSFGEDEVGELYICYSNGQIDKMVRATAPISGRVFTPEMSGLKNAIVVLTDSSGVSRRVFTTPFGIYQFDSVPTGLSYTITVSSKRFRFPAKNVSLDAELVNFDFVGQE